MPRICGRAQVYLVRLVSRSGVAIPREAMRCYALKTITKARLGDVARVAEESRIMQVCACGRRATRGRACLWRATRSTQGGGGPSAARTWLM